MPEGLWGVLEDAIIGFRGWGVLADAISAAAANI
jgi:hypothetical protein